MDNLNKESKYHRAKEKVDAIKKFYGDLFRYVFVIGLLAAINYWTDGWRYMWFLWAAFGMGIGLVFKAIKTFNPFLGRDWEDRKIKEFMDEEKNEDQWK